MDIGVNTNNPCLTRDEAITRLFIKFSDHETFISIIRALQNKD